MASYRVVVAKSVTADVEALPMRDRRRVVERIGALADDPRPPGCEKLSLQERYRVRQGEYRIIYSVDDASRVVCVVKVGHRGDVYRKR